MKKARLGVNIDHVATLRQARGGGYPSVSEAAEVVLQSGADQITIHLREDRRHIQDTDTVVVRLVTQKYNKPLNLELAANDDVLNIACEIKPDWVCLVPEKREERTTEGGLNLLDNNNLKKIKEACEFLKENIKGVKISLFVEAHTETLKKVKELPVDAVEIHTGDYARACLNGEELGSFIQEFTEGKKYIESLGLSYHAGHGLTDESLFPLASKGIFEEYNIGHWIISDSIFSGLKNSTQKLISILKNC